jgi:hypothetical protein
LKKACRKQIIFQKQIFKVEHTATGMIEFITSKLKLVEKLAAMIQVFFRVLIQAERSLSKPALYPPTRILSPVSIYRCMQTRYIKEVKINVFADQFH